MNIALIAPNSIRGGVATVFNTLQKGLVNEGFCVDVVRFGGKNLPLVSTIYRDVLDAKHLMDHDFVLYVGNIPLPSHILARLSEVPVALFVHGFVYHELFNEMLYGANLRKKVGASVFATMFKTAVSLNTVDLYVCPSLTVCEANKISGRFVLLPHWIIPEELEFSKSSLAINNDMIRIVAYTSFADSPRLLNINHLIALAQVLKRMVKREFELIIVDPKGSISSFGPVKIVRPMSRENLLSLLASAVLYIERCIDEDLGEVALEAMAVGTPVAKLTHPRYWDRQDYKEDLILAHSFRELAEKTAEYVNNMEYYHHHHAKCCKEFVLTKRTWDAVKRPLLTALRSISIDHL